MGILQQLGQQLPSLLMAGFLLGALLGLGRALGQLSASGDSRVSLKLSLGERWLSLALAAGALVGALALAKALAASPAVTFFGAGKFCQGPGEILLSELLLLGGCFYVLSLFRLPGRPLLAISPARLRTAWCLALLLALLLLLLRANNFIAFYVLLECYNMALYTLIGSNCFRSTGGEQRWAELALKYFIISLVSGLLLLLGMALVYLSLGTLDFSFLGLYLGAPGAGMELFAGRGLSLGLLFFTLGLCLKLGLAPFHLWIGSVYDVLPAEVFGFLMIFPKVVFLFILGQLLAKGNLVPVTLDGGLLGQLLLALGLLNILAGALGALGQRSVRRVLMFSSLSHMGYVFLGLAAAGPAMTLAVQGYLLAYFVSGGYLLLALGQRLGGSRWHLGDLGRFRGGFPGEALALVNFMGFPLTLPFLAKYNLLVGLFGQGSYLAPLAILLASVLGVIYTFPLLKQIWFSGARPALAGRLRRLPLAPLARRPRFLRQGSSRTFQR